MREQQKLSETDSNSPKLNETIRQFDFRRWNALEKSAPYTVLHGHCLRGSGTPLIGASSKGGGELANAMVAGTIQRRPAQVLTPHSKQTQAVDEKQLGFSSHFGALNTPIVGGASWSSGNGSLNAHSALPAVQCPHVSDSVIFTDHR